MSHKKFLFTTQLVSRIFKRRSRWGRLSHGVTVRNSIFCHFFSKMAKELETAPTSFGNGKKFNYSNFFFQVECCEVKCFLVSMALWHSLLHNQLLVWRRNCLMFFGTWLCDHHVMSLLMSSSSKPSFEQKNTKQSPLQAVTGKKNRFLKQDISTWSSDRAKKLNYVR